MKDAFAPIIRLLIINFFIYLLQFTSVKCSIYDRRKMSNNSLNNKYVRIYAVRIIKYQKFPNIQKNLKPPNDKTRHKNYIKSQV